MLTDMLLYPTLPILWPMRTAFVLLSCAPVIGCSKSSEASKVDRPNDPADRAKLDDDKAREEGRWNNMTEAEKEARFKELGIKPVGQTIKPPKLNTKDDLNKPTPTDPSCLMTAATYFKSWEENEIAAWDKLGGKMLYVVGQVKRVQHGTDNPTLALSTDDTGNREVVCGFDPARAPQLGRLRKGEWVVVCGTGSKPSASTPFLRQCSFIGPETRPGFTTEADAFKEARIWAH
jgi:hypothetical protein